MIRLFTKNATGVAPDGRWYAGDVNALEDAVAAADDLTQIIKLATLAIGESGLQLLHYGALEARLTGALRVDSIVRALGGLLPGAFTTAERNAIPLGSRPYGMGILNVTTNQWEWNKGSDAVPNWQPMTPVIAPGSIGTTELADDSVTVAKIAANAVGASEIIDGSVGTTELGALSVTQAKAAAGAFAGQAYGTAFPTTGLYNGYNFTFFHTDVTGTVPVDYIYRADLDGTHPWHVVGTKELLAVNAADFAFNTVAAAWQDLSTPAVVRAGDYIFKMSWTGGTNDTSAGGPGSWVRMTIGSYTGGARTVVTNMGTNGRAPAGGQEVRYVAGISAAALVHLQGQVGAASNGTVEGLSLVVIPIRVI